jgi:hypothetical protein
MKEESNLIPKIIHYCWFGGNPLPELAQKCISSWKKFFPDYEIKEWNEQNYDVNKILYTKQAYEAKKYAFVSDYARFDILYQYGGLYFDTDVEVIKPMDEILKRGAFAGVERTGDASSLNAGLGLASPAASPIYKEILDSYKDTSFLNEDGTQNLTTVVTRVSDIFKNHGLKDIDEIQTVAGVTVYPVDYFCPKDYITGKMNITQNTHTIHWYDGSWLLPIDREMNTYIYKILSKYGKSKKSTFLIVFHRLIKSVQYFGFGKKFVEYWKSVLKNNN